MRAYRATTTFLGAGRHTGFYFSTEEAARDFLATCENGEITPVNINIDWLPYEGCYWSEIDYWEGVDA